MGKNRDSLSIIGDILRSASANSGANKTKIMFSANLSFKLLEKYLSIVINSGLIQVRDRKYELTPQGQEFIKNYSSFVEHHLAVRKMSEDVDFERKRLVTTYSKTSLG